jgi:hypothetical protein
LPKQPKPSSFDITELHLTVGNNGYLVETQDEAPDDVFVFPTFDALTAWLFTHLTKPANAITN